MRIGAVDVLFMHAGEQRMTRTMHGHGMETCAGGMTWDCRCRACHVKDTGNPEQNGRSLVTYMTCTAGQEKILDVVEIT